MLEGIARPRPDVDELRLTQQGFLDDLTGRRTRSEAERQTAFRRPRRGSVADRWHVYAHGYTARIVEASPCSRNEMGNASSSKAMTVSFKP